MVRWMWVPAGVGGLEELAVGHLLARGQEGALQRHRGTLYRGTFRGILFRGTFRGILYRGTTYTVQRESMM